MSSYDNTNRFSMWGNTRKREGKQDADFTGEINIEGVDYWINGWKRKEGANSKSPALSGSVRRKGDERPARQDAPPPDDSDIPF